MLGIRIAYGAIFGVTGMLAWTMLGHARGLLDLFAFLSAIGGLILTWRLGAYLTGKPGGPIKLAIVLGFLAVLPIRLGFEIVREMMGAR